MIAINEWESQAAFFSILSLKHAKRRSLAEAETAQWMNMCQLMAHILTEQGHADSSFVGLVLAEYKKMVDSYAN
jgi:hypothetical protein